MNRFCFLLLFSFLFSPLVGEELKTHLYLNEPPDGWSVIEDAGQLPAKVKVIFVGKGGANGAFAPSINVAVEESDLTIEEYREQAKKYHEMQAGTKCTHLGKIKTTAGFAEVVQIDRSTQWGEIRFLQAMLIHEHTAYVVTATCLKKQFSSLAAPFAKAIHSFTLPLTH